MGLSTHTYTYTGGAQTFSASFADGFIESSHVRAYRLNDVDGLGEQVYLNFVWLNASEIEITDSLSAGDEIVVERTVPKDMQLVDLSAPGALTRGSISRLMRQALHVSHEAIDGRSAPVPPYDETGRVFGTRGAFVSWVARLGEIDFEYTDGTLLNVGPVMYVYSADATAVPDLPGFLPFGVLSPLHFADNTTPGVTDMTDAFNAVFQYIRDPDESNLPGLSNYKRYQFVGNLVDLRGQQYLVSDALQYERCHGMRLTNGTIIADTASSAWATNLTADADAAILTNKGSYTSSCKFDTLTVECNEVINGIYCDRNVRGEFDNVNVWGFWNQSFGIKCDQSPSPGTPFASNIVMRATRTFGTVAGAVQNLPSMPTGQGIIMHNGDIQIMGGESIRCLRGVNMSADGLISNWHASPFVVDLTATASLTNGSSTVTVTSADNIEVNDLLKFDGSATQFSVVGIAGTTITLHSNYNGVTDASSSMALSKHDAEGIRCAPASGTGPISNQITDCYFDQTVLAVHPRYKTITGNQFRKVPQPGPWAIKLLSLQANDPIVALVLDGNLADIRRGVSLIHLDGSFESEPTQCKFGSNLVRDDTQEIPIGLNFSNTWSPSITDLSNTAAAAVAEGSYYRTGRRVDFGFTLTLSSLNGASGNMFIGNLPFVCSSGTGQFYVANVGFINNVTLGSGEVITGLIFPGTNRIALYRWGTGGTVPLQSTNLSNTTGIRMSGHYYTD